MFRKIHAFFHSFAQLLITLCACISKELNKRLT